MSKRRGCPTGKTPYRSKQLAALGARRFAQQLVREGRITFPIYVYECSCETYHLTSASKFLGEKNHLIFQPVRPELQVELFSAEARRKYEQRQEQERAECVEELLRRLPDPVPQPEKLSYANRPKGLRYRR